jgi:hypothetical protein
LRITGLTGFTGFGGFGFLGILFPLVCVLIDVLVDVYTAKIVIVSHVSVVNEANSER